jgi:hypothetical protein
MRWAYLAAGLVLAAGIIAAGIVNWHSWSWGDFPTWVLAVGAIVTSIFAIRAFGKQSRELRVLEQQARDQRVLTEQQGTLLKLQSDQLDIQRQQLDDQRKVNARQAKIAELQAKELRESLDDRQREREMRHRDQAARVFTRAESAGADTARYYVHVENTSDRPIYDVVGNLHTRADGGSARHSHTLLSHVVRAIAPGDHAKVPEEGLVLQESPSGSCRAWSSASFRDAVGAHWDITAQGGITERNGPPLGIGPPV